LDQNEYHHGIVLFNRAKFYDAHEVLEDVWRPVVGPERLFLQGLIQVAVALHHHSTGNLAGCRSLLGRAARNLSGYPNLFCGLHLPPLRESLEAWQSALDEGRPVPALPVLEIENKNLK
jgi:uncharacterized protein